MKCGVEAGGTYIKGPVGEDGDSTIVVGGLSPGKNFPRRHANAFSAVTRVKSVD